LVRHRNARKVSEEECLDLLQVAYENNLVQFGENVQKEVNEDICLGCAVCVRTCLSNSIILKSRSKRVITPVDGTNRVVMMAIERGKLQNLIFDNHVLWSHRALAGVLGAILKLPKVKRAMASEQMKSRYLEVIINRFTKMNGMK